MIAMQTEKAKDYDNNYLFLKSSTKSICIHFIDQLFHSIFTFFSHYFLFSCWFCAILYLERISSLTFRERIFAIEIIFPRSDCHLPQEERIDPVFLNLKTILPILCSDCLTKARPFYTFLWSMGLVKQYVTIS